MGVIGLYVLINMIINGAFLKSYYTKQKEAGLRDSYSKICSELDQVTDTDLIRERIEIIEEGINIQTYIIDGEYTEIYSTRGTGDAIVPLSGTDGNAGVWFNSWMVPMSSDHGPAHYVVDADTSVFSDEPYTERRFFKKRGTEYISLLAKFGAENGMEYFIIINTPIAAIEESISINTRFAIISMAIIMLIGLAVTPVVSRNMVSPFIRMSRTAKKIANLDFTDRVPVNSNDEIGELATSINEMSAQLEEKIQELNVANEQLRRDIIEKEAIDRMKTELISNVSHELKTPLSIIMGYSEGLQLGVNDDEKDYYCSIILDEAEKMNDLASRLLNLAELESGGSQLDIAPMDLAKLAKDRTEKLRILLDENGVSIDCESKGNCVVAADSGRIEEVINNLLSNAMHHTPDKGKIRVKVIQKVDCVEFSVYNSGSHIPQSSLNYVWDSFYKVDKARTRKYGGSGLGLKIVSTILDLHSSNGIKTSYSAENTDDGVIFRFTVAQEDGKGEREN